MQIYFRRYLLEYFTCSRGFLSFGLLKVIIIGTFAKRFITQIAKGKALLYSTMRCQVLSYRRN